MKKMFMSAAMVAVLAVSCTNEEVMKQAARDGQLFTIEVSQNAGSRTALNEDGSTVWSDGDQIFVTSADGKTTGVLTLKENNGTSGTFSGFIFGGEPEELEHIVFPVPQDGKIEVGVPTAGKLNIPMIGSMEDGTLSNVGGIVKLSINSANDNQTINLSGENSNGGEVVNGYYEFNSESGSLTFVPSIDGSVTVTLQSGNNEILLPVATTATADSEEVTISMTVGESSTPTEITVPVQQSQISANEVPNVNVSGEGAVEAGTVVGSADELVTALAKGGDIKLAKSFEVESEYTFEVTNTTTIDLNGFLLGLGDNTISVKSNLTLKDSSESMNEGVGAIYSVSDVLTVYTGSTLEMGDYVELMSTENCCIFVPREQQNINMTVYGGSMTSKSGGYAAIYANGSASVNLTIKTCNIKNTTDIGAIYYPANGDLTINGGTIVGGEFGVEYRGSGTFTLNGGTFVSTATTFSATANGNGSTIVGAAVAISPYADRDQTVVVNAADFVAEAGCYGLWEDVVLGENEQRTGTTTVTYGGKANVTVSAGAKVHVASNTGYCDGDGCNTSVG